MALEFDFETVNGVEKNDFQLNIERFQIEILTPTALIPYSSEGTGILSRYDTSVIPGAVQNRNEIAETINKYSKLSLLKAKIIQNNENTNQIQCQLQYNPTGATADLGV